MTRRLWLAWLLLIGTTVQAAELTHFFADGKIGARVQALRIPGIISQGPAQRPDESTSHACELAAG